MENSPLRTLKGSDLHRYQEKLRVILEVPENVNLLDFCPYSSKKLHWETLDLKKWPPLHYDNVCDFLLNTPGPYSTTMPSARRSLREGLDFFRSGHVAEVEFVFSPEKKNVIAKSHVKSSQGQQKYASWVGFKHTTLPTVIGAHCTCMAGHLSYASFELLKKNLALTQPKIRWVKEGQINIVSIGKSKKSTSNVKNFL